jgi:hypothetical protein
MSDFDTKIAEAYQKEDEAFREERRRRVEEGEQV